VEFYYAQQRAALAALVARSRATPGPAAVEELVTTAVSFLQRAHTLDQTLAREREQTLAFVHGRNERRF
jgi:hypothetical protein